MDHDQRFKTLIAVFFQEFLQLFFESWADRLDAAAVVWLDKEIFPDPPEGKRRILDLVGKVPTRQAVKGQRPGDCQHWLTLVHVEIEAPDQAAGHRPWMFESYVYLRQKHGIPVLPIVLYLRVGLEGIGIDVYEEDFWELDVVRFKYLYVGLPALDAIKYVQGENYLGVALAALMGIPKDKIAWLGAEALRRIQEAPLSEQKRFLLADCVQAYLPLDEEQQKEFEQLINTEPYRGVSAMNTTIFEKGIEKGIETGIEKGRRNVLRETLEERFGPLAPGIIQRLDEMSIDRVRSLQKAVSKAESLAELGLDR